MKQNIAMTIQDLFSKGIGIVNDCTEIIIRDNESFCVITSGKWFERNILNYGSKEIEGFTWEKENIVYIDIFDTKGILIAIIDIKFEPYPVYVYMNNGFYYTESKTSEYSKLCSCDSDYREYLSYAYY